ncbi:50S ribosomal protein L4 [Metallosphaera tengchongensis]|uniref:Large ribosomal subunit protein uL4 n=1 Tax=Metallosphaera tengchongensis TaxID=1532350 RepID=A0A6N0NT93_9CREN|nr:50S ribosomal protein L4 [Metallosphaera tengchongensis]QKQ99921.1 50S ribosomal protein L4 [Metallosphaera tengchongensis]
MFFQLVEKKAQVIDLSGNKVKEISLPKFFSFPVRKDLIRRAFHSSFTKGLQPKGRDPAAGKRTTAKSFGINLGLARVPRIRGAGEGALAPNTVGGRLAFPPSTRERIVEEINEKEKRLAILSGLASTTIPRFVISRGHKVKLDLPLIVTDDLGNISKSSDLEDVLTKIGLSEELKRAKNKRVRAGKGKMRGRRYKRTRGPLLVVHDSKLPVVKAASNLPGVDVISAKELSIIHLAPGGHPGRLVIYTESSIKELENRFGGMSPK